MIDPATGYSVWALAGAFFIGAAAATVIMGLASAAGKESMCARCLPKWMDDQKPRLCEEMVMASGKTTRCTHLTVPGSRFCRQHFAAHA